jgi:hypothetical protein
VLKWHGDWSDFQLAGGNVAVYHRLQPTAAGAIMSRRG